MLARTKTGTVKFTQEQIDYLRTLGLGRPSTPYPANHPHVDIIAREAVEAVLQHMQQNVGNVFNNREA